VWGLVEIYRGKERRFDDEEVALACGLAGEVSDLLARLERPEQPG
jgi:GAF domain-containing protein